jgi:flagellar hook protein FlgE
MFDAILIASTGLSAYSRGLSNISNNVSNLNTAAYKRSSMQFQDLIYNQSSTLGREGNGVIAGKPLPVFTQGELRRTGNALDVAIEGDGYFILNKDGKTFYTRDGQFDFDSDGVLVGRQSRMPVMSLSDTGQLVSLNITPLRNMAGTPTALIKLDGTLSTVDSDRSHTISDINVVSATGVATKASLVFNDETDPAVTGVDHRWGFTVRNERSETVASGTLIFGSDGSPATGADKFAFDWPSPGGTQKVTLDFGTQGGFAGLTSFSAGGTSTARLQSADGKTSGSYTASAYEDDGSVVLNYSNGEKRTAGRLALAWFAEQDRLVAQGASLWTDPDRALTAVGAPQTSRLGQLSGGEIEASNVDLTQQFSELIVVQRAYQASSQVISTANEMMQQLFDIRGRR